jgi:hypothetical protein
MYGVFIPLTTYVATDQNGVRRTENNITELVTGAHVAILLKFPRHKGPLYPFEIYFTSQRIKNLKLTSSYASPIQLI